MRRVPRHLFVPEELRPSAYEDHPLPIGEDQTISQPYMVAYMTDVLGLTELSRVLEVGTGCGYQTAVLAELAAAVFTIEIVPALAERARTTLAAAGYTNVHVRVGDGYEGWPAHAPFDAIIVTAAPDHVPPPLIDQLVTDGRMVIPVGKSWSQEVVILNKTTSGVVRTRTIAVRFVPLVRSEGQRE